VPLLWGPDTFNDGAGMARIITFANFHPLQHAAWHRLFWNADDHRLFPPKRVGMGWTLNLRELLRRLRIFG
jgi:Family of unknown function (DUF5808)